MTEFKYINEITWCKNSRITFNDTALNGTKRKFTSIPQHFQAYGGDNDDDKTEDWYNAILIKSPNPSIGDCGYKHSHLYSAGKKYILNDKEISMKANFNGLFPIGDISDWQWSDECNNYIRFQNIPAERKVDSKAMAIASFLRFIDPLNHFLSPKSKKNGNVYNQYEKTDGSIGNDIAEYDELLQYAQKRMRERYGADVYEEFGKLALIKEFKPANGDLVINIRFSTDPIGDNTPSENITATPKSTTIIQNNAVSNYTQKIGAATKKLFISLLEEDRLSPSMIANLRDKQYCSNEIGSSFPVIVVKDEDSFDMVRYYKDLLCGKYYISSQWYEKHRIRITRWLKDNDLEDKIDLLYTQPENITVPTENTTNAVNTTVDKNITVSDYTLKIGAAAKKLFISLLEDDRLSPSMIANLRDKQYCSSEIGSSFPVIVVKDEDSFDNIRYYKNLLCGKYYLSSQWYEKHRDRLITWLSDNSFEDKITLLQ